MLGGQRQRGAPLPGTGLGRDICHPLFLAIVCLRNGGIKLMASNWADTLVFEVYMCLCAKCLFETSGPHERGWPIDFIHLPDLLGNLDVAIGVVQFL